MKNNIVQQIVIAGLLTGIAILLGSFARFFLFGPVYLIGIIIFLMPLFLRLDFLLISTIISVSISDLISGYGYYAWISAIAYSIAVLILWLFSKGKYKLLYVIGVFVSSGTLLLSYFILEFQVFGIDFAIKDSFGTMIELAIVVPVTVILYFPMKIISKTLKK